MNKIFFFLSLLLSGLFYSPSSQAQCGLTLTVSNISISWNLNFSEMAVQMTVNKANAMACSFGIGISKGGASSYAARSATSGSKQLSYQIYSDNGLSNVVKDVPDIAAPTDVIAGGFQAGANLTQNILYYFTIPLAAATSPTLVGDGTYTDSFMINIYEGANPLAFVTPVASASVSLTVAVPPLIALAVVNPGGGFTAGSTSRNINFGTLAAGQSSSFDLRVQTNAGYNVTFSSQNNGFLKHTNPALNSTVPYTLFVNGGALSLAGSSSTPVLGLFGSGQTGTSGLAYPLKIVIGSVSGPNTMGGPHQDFITITATTTE